jgi:hypothetical protein
MPNSTIQLPWGSDQLTLTLPESWRVAGVLEPALPRPIPDPVSGVLWALFEPVGSPGLKQLAGQVGPEKHVAVVMDDGSRPTPVAHILPSVLKELERGGVTRDRVTLVTAPGVHRGMEAAEVEQRAGVSGLAWENPDCDDPGRLAYLGKTSRGTPVWVNKTVAEAGLVVSIGCIEPHIIASFGGGYKNLVPGVAGRATIAHNHALNCAPGTFNMVGRPIEANPMRLDLEEAAGMLKAPVFIVNTILNHCQEVVKVVAGNPIAAHRAGVAASAGMYGVKVARPADVVITGSAPMDSDLRQGVKALANTIRAVRPGGIMFTCVRAVEGVGVFGLANRKLPLGRRALKTLAPVLLKAVPTMKMRGMGEEDRFFLYFALQAMRRAQLLMYAPTIPAEIQERLPFVQFQPDPAESLRLAGQRFPSGAEVLVFPHGGITYPDLG